MMLPDERAHPASLPTSARPKCVMLVPGGVFARRYRIQRLLGAGAMGHSMGSTLGISIAGVDPRINGYVFSGAGGMLVE